MWCETSTSCFSHAPNQGPGPQPRHVPWLGITLATFQFAGRCSIHWATPARACIYLLKCPCPAGRNSETTFFASYFKPTSLWSRWQIKFKGTSRPWSYLFFSPSQQTPAIEHLKWGYSGLRCAVSLKCMSDLAGCLGWSIDACTKKLAGPIPSQMPMLQVGSPAWAHLCCSRRTMFLSLSPSLPLSLKINKIFF